MLRDTPTHLRQKKKFLKENKHLSHTPQNAESKPISIAKLRAVEVDYYTRSSTKEPPAPYGHQSQRIFDICLKSD
jgi:hypothetical protein